MVDWSSAHTNSRQQVFCAFHIVHFEIGVDNTKKYLASHAAITCSPCTSCEKWIDETAYATPVQLCGQDCPLQSFCLRSDVSFPSDNMDIVFSEICISRRLTCKIAAHNSLPFQMMHNSTSQYCEVGRLCTTRPCLLCLAVGQAMPLERGLPTSLQGKGALAFHVESCHTMQLRDKLHVV